MRATFSAPVAQPAQAGIDVTAIHIHLKQKQVTVVFNRIDASGNVINTPGAGAESVPLLPAASIAICTLMKNNIGTPLGNALNKTLTDITED